MRKMVTLVAIVFFSIPVSTAIAHPSDSSENANQVDCGSSRVPLDEDTSLNVTLNHDGLEICNDNDALPVKGRVIVSTDPEDPYMSIDGDERNEDPIDLIVVTTKAYLRVDSDGIWCEFGDSDDPAKENSCI